MLTEIVMRLQNPCLQSASSVLPPGPSSTQHVHKTLEDPAKFGSSLGKQLLLYLSSFPATAVYSPSSTTESLEFSLSYLESETAIHGFGKDMVRGSVH